MISIHLINYWYIFSMILITTLSMSEKKETIIPCHESLHLSWNIATEGCHRWTTQQCTYNIGIFWKMLSTKLFIFFTQKSASSLKWVIFIISLWLHNIVNWAIRDEILVTLRTWLGYVVRVVVGWNSQALSFSTANYFDIFLDKKIKLTTAILDSSYDFPLSSGKF